LPIKLSTSPTWQFFATLSKGSRRLAATWWVLIITAGALPALFSVSVGLLISAIQRDADLTLPLVLLGAVFAASLAQAPALAQIAANLGDSLAKWLYARLLRSATSPAGIAHLEAREVVGDLAVAQDFDRGLSGPSLSLSLGIISNGLVSIAIGFAQTLLLFGFAWWAPFLVGGSWASTHWLLRESTVWDRSEGEVQVGQRQAEYAYRVAVDGLAAKEIRLFGLPGWLTARFITHRRHLLDLRLHATRLRHRPMRWAVLLVGAANGLFFWSLGREVVNGTLGAPEVVVYAQAAIGAGLLAFGGIGWALAFSAEGVATALRLSDGMATVGRLDEGTAAADGMPAHSIRFRNVSFAYPSTGTKVLDGLDLDIPAGQSMAIVGLNGAGKTTLIKLLCRLYDPSSGVLEVDGQNVQTFTVDSWRRRLTAVFQDFARYELSLRDNVAPLGAPDDVIRAALAEAGAAGLRDLDAVLARGYDNGTDLSGGQWQRVALARALCSVRQGAGVVILDEPTAQLDVRGEAEIFDRVLDATKGRTTLLISHRFSTVRRADQICVLEGGKVVELGSHESLMELDGRYRAMFDLQASRFDEEDSDVARS
jgi:ATP-binding cassette, subfamily B, bacterial